MGVKIQTLSAFFAEHNRESIVPSRIILQKQLFAELGNYLPNLTTLQAKVVSQDLAHLFHRYGLCEERRLLDWLEKDGWQQKLWRQLYQDGGWSYPARNCQKIKIDEAPYLFGFSALPAPIALFFKRIGSPFFFFSPCRLFWADLRPGEERSPLTLWGNWGRRFLNVCAIEEMEIEENYQEPNLSHSLGLLQNSILDLEPAHLERAHLEPAHPFSCKEQAIRIFSAKDRREEIEELFETIASLLHDDQTLSPSDILVLAPDLDPYLPHIHTVFRKAEGMFAYALSGISRKSNSLFAQGFLLLFAVIEENWDFHALISLLSHPNFAKKRNWDQAATDTIELWLRAAKMTYSEEKLELSLTRLILGLCTTSLYPMAPCPLVDWPQADLLDSLIQTIEELRRDLRIIPRSLDEWLSLLLLWKERYFVSEEEPWFEEEVEQLRAMSLLREKATTREAIVRQNRPDSVVDPSIYTWQDAKELCETIFSKKTGTYQRHIIEAIHFDTLDEGHILTKKVIALIGLERGSFPRVEREIGFDQMEFPPASRVEIDRYLFLEAIIHAKERLLLSFLHASPEDGSPLQPSIVIQEILTLFQNLTIEKLPEIAFLSRERYFSTHRYHLMSAHRQKMAEKPLLAKEWHAFTELEPPVVEECTIDIADLHLLLRDPVQFFLKKTLSLSLEYRNEAAFYEEEFFLKKYARQRLLKEAFAAPMEILMQRKVEGGEFPRGSFQKSTALQLHQEWAAVQTDCERHQISLSDLMTLDIPLLKFQWDDNHQITLKGTIDYMTKQHGLISFFKETNSQMSIWARWPELLLLRVHPELQEIPSRITLAYAKKNALRDFCWLNGEKELRNLLYYYFLATKRLSPLYPKWVKAIALSRIDELPDKIEAESSRYLQWIIQRDGLPNSTVLCNTWATIATQTFSALLQ
jgi:exodeoxyribonuclease V gamma subunit